MASTYMTPGVYIEEKNAFPNSAVAVETAVPVFIGYTERADSNNVSLTGKPVKITSFAEYLQSFGPANPANAYKVKYSVSKIASDADIAAISDATKQADAKTLQTKQLADLDNKLMLGTENLLISAPESPLYLYNSIRLFYANGGSTCYILSVGNYATDGFAFSAADFVGSADKADPFVALTKESEPTLVVIPDANALGSAAYNSIYTKALQHCNDMQSRFAILDVANQASTQSTDEVIAEFRDDIGINNLNYGAAYYPWLKSAIVLADEVTIDNIDLGGVTLDTILPEAAAKSIVTNYAADTDATALGTALTAAQAKAAATGATDADKAAVVSIQKKIDSLAANPTKLKENYNQALKANSPTYVAILDKIRAGMNLLPPSGAMAGLYTMVDTNRGVWKAPANVSVNSVNAPAVNVSHDMQQNLNVDVMAGKSVNVIRAFPGVGTLVWGARTLDGNSQDWRYINVRRTLIMIEQSLKLAARAYVFEPNDANTWITVKSMMDNFLVNLWKQGALAGAVPEQAFSVSVGLGSTMTGNDILDGKMLITVKLAIVRPAEFIVITFQQQMQES